MLNVSLKLPSVILAFLLSFSCEKLVEDSAEQSRGNLAKKENGEDKSSQTDLSFTSLTGKNTSIGKFSFEIETPIDSDDLSWEIKDQTGTCDNFEFAKNKGKTVLIDGISPDTSSVFICVYQVSTKKALMETAYEITLSHDLTITSSHSSSGPLLSVHGFTNTDLNLTFAAALKGRSIELYKTEEKVVGTGTSPSLTFVKNIDLHGYYKGSLKYGDHLLLYTARDVWVIENFITTSDYTPKKIIASTLEINNALLKGDDLVLITAIYGLKVYSLLDLANVTLDHDVPLSEYTLRAVIHKEHLYTSNNGAALAYNIADFDNVMLETRVTISGALFKDGKTRPVEIIKDTHDDSSVVYIYHPEMTYFYHWYKDDTSTWVVQYQDFGVTLGTRALAILPDDKLMVEFNSKQTDGAAANRIILQSQLVLTSSGIDSIYSTTGNYADKTTDLKTGKCQSVNFGANPYAICSHVGPEISVINHNRFAAGFYSGYEQIVTTSPGAASYVVLKSSDDGLHQKAVYNHETNSLSLYKGTGEKGASDNLIHSSYNPQAYVIDGFGYGRNANELVAYTPYNTPSKFHLINVNTSSSAEYIGITADQDCNGKTHELTGGKNIYIDGENVLEGDYRSVYSYKLMNNGTDTLYDDYYSCEGYFELESPILDVFNQPNHVIFKVNGGLYVFDKKDLTQPPKLIPILANILEVAISGNIMYTVDSLSVAAIKAYDISNYSSPKFLFSDTSFNQIYKMISTNDFLLVHDLNNMSVSVHKMSGDQSKLDTYSSVKIPIESLKDYDTLQATGNNEEIIFPMYEFGYLKFEIK